MMKNIGIMLTALLAGAVAASCANFDEPVYPVTEPASVAEMNYLKEYLPLKEYLAAGTDFRLGVGISSAELSAHGVPYRAAVANFNEVVAGNDFKYASVVNDQGAIDAGRVTTFVNEARDAGISVYGHTLLWHAQQQPKYLNNLLQYPRDPVGIPVLEIDFANEDLTNFPHNDGAIISYVDGPDGSRALKITNEDMKTNNWDCQAAVFYPEIEAGVQYKLKMKIRADVACNVGSQYHGPNFSNYLGGGPQIAFTTEWKDYERLFTNDLINGTLPRAITFEMGHTVTSYYFADVVIERWYPEGIGGGPAGDGGHALKLTNDVAQANGYNVQVAYTLPEAVDPDTDYTFSFWAKATSAYNMGFFWQSTIDGSQAYPPGANVGTEWALWSSTSKAGANKNRVTLNIGNFVGTIWIDEVSLKADGSDVNLIENGDFEVTESYPGRWSQWGKASGSAAERSPDGEGYVAATSAFRPTEEKVVILTEQLDRWIKAMMEATGADAETGATTYVKAWDLVNEPMDDGNPFALKTGDIDGNGAPDDMDNPNFYWQDHMGKDYVRVAARLARQYGGNDLKLFANDYNLEAVYNNNNKARGLIEMVNYWESDGVTKIDGLGTQMHISYNVDPARQKAQEDAIVTMFQLMAATGKLVKVTELDMGINDANGNPIQTANVTTEQAKAMATFYKFIVDKYFELVPAAQRYGITQWSPTDQPANSGWRANTPAGLWDVNWSRKHTYAGFADGLNGK